MSESKTIQENPGGSGVILIDPEPKKMPLGSQRFRWCFTLNNYSIQEIDDVLFFLKEHCKKWTFQEEIGEEETPHLQGCFWLKKKLYLKDLKGLMSSRAHFEPMKGTDSQSREYCNNIEKRNGKLWEFGWSDKKNEYFKKLMDKISTTLHPWQDDLSELLHCEPDDRTIYWIKSEPGCGKTSFCKWKILTENWLYLKKAKYNDIMNYIYNADTETARGIFIDLTLENENNISYSALESIKDGMIFNSKYETGFKMIQPLHCVVFANVMPDVGKLGKDRWKIYTIDEVKNELLPVESVEPTDLLDEDL